ncbi:hypothetical protein, partial [Paracoccus sp. FO-3]|uniref:hypothetical protein n=1 Tax=Paracoccus sp. FO-3 TaxID=1335059 RepID=UPI001C616A1A
LTIKGYATPAFGMDAAFAITALPAAAALHLLDKTGFCRNISASGVMLISENPPCPPSMMCSVSNGSSTIFFECMLRAMDGMERHLCPPCSERLVSRSMASRRQFRACRTGSATYCSAGWPME